MRSKIRYKVQEGKKPELIDKNHGTYGALLLDERWRNKRKEILKRDNNQCRCCQSKSDLQIHHRQYHFNNIRRTFKNPWDYPNDLMIVLCKTCHQKGHQAYIVPIKYI